MLRQLLDLYRETCDAPATPASAVERRHGLLTGAFSEDALRLIGPGGALPADVAPRNVVSMVAGVQNTVSNIGGVVGPIVNGLWGLGTAVFLWLMGERSWRP